MAQSITCNMGMNFLAMMGFDANPLNSNPEKEG